MEYKCMKRLSDRKFSLKGEEAIVNPMDGLANLADIMLILAVGIMLALVINWNLDIGTFTYIGGKTQDKGVSADDALTFKENDMEKLEGEAEKVSGDGLKKLGTVYYDEASGTYYVIEENND